MNISQMMQKNPYITIKVGNRWLSAGFSPANTKEPALIVNQRLLGKKTQEIIRTSCEDTAVTELLKGLKVYEKYRK